MGRKPLIIYNNLLPVKEEYVSVNIYGLIFARKNFHVDTYILQHELIHSAQAKDLCRIKLIGFTLFYILYFYYKMKYKGKKNNPLEREACKNCFNHLYIYNRKKYAWREYENTNHKRRISKRII